MSLFLLYSQSVFVASFGFQACQLGSYFISIHNYHEMALHAVPTVEPTINELIVGGAVLCPLPWSFGAENVPVVVLLG